MQTASPVRGRRISDNAMSFIGPTVARRALLDSLPSHDDRHHFVVSGALEGSGRHSECLAIDLCLLGLGSSSQELMMRGLVSEEELLSVDFVRAATTNHRSV